MQLQRTQKASVNAVFLSFILLIVLFHVNVFFNIWDLVLVIVHVLSSKMLCVERK